VEWQIFKTVQQPSRWRGSPPIAKIQKRFGSWCEVVVFENNNQCCHSRSLTFGIFVFLTKMSQLTVTRPAAKSEAPAPLLSTAELKLENKTTRALPSISRPSAKSEAPKPTLETKGDEPIRSPPQAMKSKPASAVAAIASSDVGSPAPQSAGRNRSAPVSPSVGASSPGIDSDNAMTPSQRASQRRSISKKDFHGMTPSPDAASGGTQLKPGMRPKHMRNRSRSETSLTVNRKHALSVVSKEKGLPAAPTPEELSARQSKTPPARLSGTETNLPFDPNFGLKSLRKSKGELRSSEDIKIQTPVIVSATPTPPRSSSLNHLADSDNDTKEEVIDLQSEVPIMQLPTNLKQQDSMPPVQDRFSRRGMSEAVIKKSTSTDTLNKKAPPSAPPAAAADSDDLPKVQPVSRRSISDAPHKKLPPSAAAANANSDELPKASPLNRKSMTEAPEKKLPSMPPVESSPNRSLFDAPEKKLPNPATRSRSLTNRRVKDQ
jgi:hypothetical protein